MTETHTPHARTARDVARKGPNAVLHEDVPACWLPYLQDGNPEGLEDDGPWSAAACHTWAEHRAAEGYICSGPAPHAEEPEWGDFGSLCGDLARVCLVNQDVLDSDADADLFSVGGTDELPSEYVLRRDVDGVVRLPINFEPRIADPGEPVDDPRHAETPPMRPFRNAEDARHAPERIDPDEATDVDEAWTTPACDLALLHLKVDGWRVECELPGCERDGWYAGRYGRTSLWLVTRNTTPAETAPRQEHERPHAYTLHGTTLRAKTARGETIGPKPRNARTLDETIDDAVRRLPGATRPEDVDVRAWTADFSDASLGFGGPAGQTTTTALVIAVTDHRHIEVYVAGRHAYTACTGADETVLGRMFHCCLPGRAEARRTLAALRLQAGAPPLSGARYHGRPGHQGNREVLVVAGELTHESIPELRKGWPLDHRERHRRPRFRRTVLRKRAERLTPQGGNTLESGLSRKMAATGTRGELVAGGPDSNQLDGEVGYGLPVGSRFVGTPRIGFSTSEIGRDYRVGYGLGVLDRKILNLELGVTAGRVRCWAARTRGSSAGPRSDG